MSVNVCFRIKKFHAALNLAAFYRKKASEKPAGYYRINELAQAREVLERAKKLRLNATFPDSI